MNNLSESFKKRGNNFWSQLFEAPPVTFKTKLRNLQVEEENNVTLSCELSKSGLAVEWRKGEEVLKNNFKYQIKNRSGCMDLTIKNTQLEDSGLYSCNCGAVKTTANVTITREKVAEKPSRFMSSQFFKMLQKLKIKFIVLF